MNVSSSYSCVKNEKKKSQQKVGEIWIGLIYIYIYFVSYLNFWMDKNIFENRIKTTQIQSSEINYHIWE
jgi:hypothetical protein